MKKENGQICTYNHKLLSIFDGVTWKICEQCQLIYASQKKGLAYKINEQEHFDCFPEGNRHEFNSCINKFQKYIKKNTNQLTFFDFGCGAGGELIQAQKRFKKVSGFEPNKKLYDLCLSKSLNVINNFDEIFEIENVDVCFAKNPFRYVDNFLYTFQAFIDLIKPDGFLVWRDKYFNWIPRPNLGFGEVKVNPSQTENYLMEDTIIFHLERLGMKIHYKKFYFNDTFFIVAQKGPYKKKFKNKKVNRMIVFNEKIIGIIHILRKKLNYLRETLQKLIYFIRI